MKPWIGLLETTMTKPPTPWVGYYTKDQLQRVLASIGVTEPIPTKGKALYIAFPPSYVRRLAKITVSPHKSTYGKRLYKYVLQ